MTRRNAAFIETLPGFLRHTVFEKTQGTIGFDMATEFAGLRVVASLGYCRAPEELQ